MTSSQIETLANLDGVGKKLDLQMLLRTEAIQTFWADVGEARWKNKTATLTLTIGTQQSDLPDNFGKMLRCVLPPSTGQQRGWDVDQLLYIGEDQTQILNAEINSTLGKPSAYWTVNRSADPYELKAIKFNLVPDAAYTMYYSYESAPVFDDMSSDVNMDSMIDPGYQVGLVKQLRMLILRDRIGSGDSRYSDAQAEYGAWVERTQDRGKDQARRRHAVFIS